MLFTEVDTDYELANLVHPKYIVDIALQLESNARGFVESIINIKNSIPPDTALYAPALATPENLAMLIYIGFDLVDTTYATVMAYQDIYL